MVSYTFSLIARYTHPRINHWNIKDAYASILRLCNFKYCKNAEQQQCIVR